MYIYLAIIFAVIAASLPTVLCFHLLAKNSASKAKMELKLAGITISFVGAAAYYYWTFQYVVEKLIPESQEQVITIEGQLDIPPHLATSHAVRFRQYPRRDVVLDDGTFIAKVVRPVGAHKVALTLQVEGYIPQVIQVDGSDKISNHQIEDSDVAIVDRNHIVIKKLIKLVPSDG